VLPLYAGKYPPFRQADRCAVTHQSPSTDGRKETPNYMETASHFGWIVSSPVPEFSFINRNVVENWIILHGCVIQDEVERPFKTLMRRKD
jgi:hypothetical protein